MPKRFFVAVFLFAFSVSLCSCASFSTKRQKLVDQVGRGEFERASSTLNKLQRRNPNLMDLMDRGLIEYHQEQFDQSNQTFETAERKIEELFAKSISREAGTFLINDLTQAYSGEEFERIYVHIFMALNYIALDQFEDALVEIRKIDFQLRVYTDQYGGKSKFSHHAFAHFLSGLVHEAGGEINPAFISYRKAIQGYQDYERYFGVKTPMPLKRNLLITSKYLGFMDVYDHHVRIFGGGISNHKLDQWKKNKEIVVLIATGKIARKVERYWGVDAPGGVLLKVAYPEFVRTPSRIRSASVQLNGFQKKSVLMEDISAIAMKTLADRIAFIQGKAIARALAKASASAAAGVVVAKETDNPELGALTAIFTNALLSHTERADTRSWLTLPEKIHVVQIPVFEKNDEETFTVSFKDGYGNTIYREDIKVSLKGKRKAVVYVRAKEP